MLVFLAAWLHDLDPFLVQFPTWFPVEGIRWYGLSYALGFVMGYLLVLRVAAVGGAVGGAVRGGSGRSPLKVDRVGDFVLWGAVGLIVGGRLGYVFFYDFDLVTQFSRSPPWWGVFAMNRGGMSSHGGMIGSVVTTLAYAHRHHLNKLFMLDVLAFGAPLGVGAGRIANFINGELYGRPVDPSFPLAVKFPQELTTSSTPQGLIDAAYYAVADANGRPPTSMEAIVQAIQRGDPRVIEAVRPLLTPRHPSQLYAAALEGLAVFIVLAIAYYRPRRAGTIAGLFGISYAIARIFDEFFRMPDAHIMNEEFARFGVTRGQWLSVLVLGAGLLVLWLTRAVKSPVLGGWGREGSMSQGTP